MLKELFEASFYITFPKKEDTVLMLDERIFQGNFGLVDAHALYGGKTEGEPQYKDSNLINSYVDLYFTLKDSIGTIQKIYSMMSDIGDNEDV